MLRLSPSDAIYRGVLSFTEVKTRSKTSVEATLDTYHQDLRFELDGNPLFYNYRTRKFTYDMISGYKEISNVFCQVLEEETGPVYYISFLFQISRDTIIFSYQVNGTLKGESVNARDRESIKNLYRN